MNIATRALFEVQETTLLAARAARRLFRRPTYLNEMISQMDVIGVGSLTIILLTGFFTGGVLALQTYPTLKFYGAQDQTGRLVARSEEHTSELQSRQYLVCRLLLEKKKNSNQINPSN